MKCKMFFKYKGRGSGKMMRQKTKILEITMLEEEKEMKRLENWMLQFGYEGERAEHGVVLRITQN